MRPTKSLKMLHLQIWRFKFEFYILQFIEPALHSSSSFLSACRQSQCLRLLFTEMASAVHINKMYTNQPTHTFVYILVNIQFRAVACTDWTSNKNKYLCMCISVAWVNLAWPFFSVWLAALNYGSRMLKCSVLDFCVVMVNVGQRPQLNVCVFSQSHVPSAIKARNHKISCNLFFATSVYSKRP